MKEMAQSQLGCWRDVAGRHTLHRLSKLSLECLQKKQKNKSESENQKENPCVRTAHYKLQITPAVQQRPTR